MATKAQSPREELASKTQATSDRYTLLTIEGMTCASCAMRVEKGLKKLPGVLSAAVNLATEQATVSYNPDETNIEQMLHKVEAVGYKATPLISQESQPEAEEHVSASETPPAPSLQEERTQRKEAALRRQRNTLILGILFTVPVVVLRVCYELLVN
jgi:Cu+-exporting ATPase